MTLQQYYIIAGAAGIAGAIFCLYFTAWCIGKLYQGLKALEGIEDYDLP